MLRYGIPRYRLPREVLDGEIERILATGVDLVCAAPVEDLATLRSEPGVDAVVLAVGAQLGRRTYLPAGDGARVLDAVRLLHDMEGAGAASPELGRRVVVYGGGNTAVDAARTARRLGVTEPLIVYRRTRERMPATAEEVREAEEEGVRLRWLSTITAVEEGEITVERMELGADGFPRPTGDVEHLGADTVVLALGQESDLGLLDGTPSIRVSSGVVDVDAAGATGEPGVFAGGDVVAEARTATAAIGSGHRAAAAADAWLRGTAAARPAPAPVVSVDQLNTWYVSGAPQAVRPRLATGRRTTGFAEVVAGLSDSEAVREAGRCMSCGGCFECDNCYGYCPDDAIEKLGAGLGFRVDLDHCKGCGICAHECPAGAIEMVPEPG
jgi:2-oxoacid:acceptor oxidoreductase delta subunit (pyruvate/2-ketoisovalerate family)